MIGKKWGAVSFTQSTQKTDVKSDLKSDTNLSSYKTNKNYENKIISMQQFEFN